MLGLPSATEVERALPKEAFYRNLKMTAMLRRDFVDGVERIVLANSVKPSSCYLADGRRVHEVLVVRLEPKGAEAPRSVVRAVMDANPNRLVVVDAGAGRAFLSEAGRMIVSDDLHELVLVGEDLDEAWDSMLAQAAFGETDGTDVLTRIDRREKARALAAEVAALDARARKERQISRRNDLFAQLKKKQAELAELRKESQ
ncbi:DUF4391 domain-containing protein [Paratractidigestivibacter sp.]|uniref:DUF4391 domain-containing protein n=1 Tax=Paratractidigestivibacter sp. TaxID=2847316 RepID=UPI002AC9114D|nr:DUF4391 domain-containing protein [Paratractidigestivibacter sp.]